MSKKPSLDSVLYTKDTQSQQSSVHQQSNSFLKKLFPYHNPKIAPQVMTIGLERQRHTKSMISRYFNKKEKKDKDMSVIGDSHRSNEVKKQRESELIVVQYRNEMQFNKTQDSLSRDKQLTVRKNLFFDQSIREQPVAEALQNIENNNQDNQYVEVERCKQKQEELKNLPTCEICCQKYFRQHQVVLDCSHSLCQNCMLKYAQQLIMQHKQIKCPFTKCGQGVKNKQLIQKLPSAVYRKYIQSTHFINNVNRNGVLICPNQQCDEGLLTLRKRFNQHSGQLDNSNILFDKLQCNKCKLQHCSNCLKNITTEQQYHAECKGWKQQQLQIQKNNDFKKCHKCKRFVQKSKGCNHMTCKCGNQFCYKCGQSWKFTHICSPFKLKKLMIENRNKQLNKISNRHINENSSTLVDDNQSPRKLQYVRYVVWMIGYALWTAFAFIFCILPLVLSFILGSILYFLTLILIGVTYGYLMVLRQIINGSNKIIVKILFILIPLLAMLKGVVLIYWQHIHKINHICFLLIKVIDLVIPFQINVNQNSD